jgi:hypothetical protein
VQLIQRPGVSGVPDEKALDDVGHGARSRHFPGSYSTAHYLPNSVVQYSCVI